MPITFYYGAGSQYAWRVWLALEHKALAYVFRLLSFSEGDLKTAGFAALNPRRKLPVLVDAGAGGAFALYESAAILEYLDDAYPESGRPLFPGDARARGVVRRMVCEADNYVAPALNRLSARILFSPQARWNNDKIAAARDEFAQELGTWVPQLRGDFLAGPLSAADFTLYPMVALALRCEKKKPDLALAAALPAPLKAWMQRIEGLPYFAKTWPAHWQ
jgi:glutathione S-transferase